MDVLDLVGVILLVGLLLSIILLCIIHGTNIEEAQRKIRALENSHADLLRQIRACSKDLSLLEGKVEGMDLNSQGDDKLIGMLLQRVGALEDARTTNEDTSE